MYVFLDEILSSFQAQELVLKEISVIMEAHKLDPTKNYKYWLTNICNYKYLQLTLYTLCSFSPIPTGQVFYHFESIVSNDTRS
jgi:hypothetical protein